MKVETVIWILIGILALIGFVCILIILKKEGEAPKAIKLGKFLLYLIIVLIFWIFIFPRNTDFYLSSEKRVWAKLKVPQIDSTMYLYHLSKDCEKYKSWSKDSIKHSHKIVNRDLFDIYSIEDDFVNYKKDLNLKMLYIKPNIIRKEKRLNVLQIRKGFNYQTIDTLNENQTESLLKAWGFDNEKLYTIKYW